MDSLVERTYSPDLLEALLSNFGEEVNLPKVHIPPPPILTNEEIQTIQQMRERVDDFI